MKLTLDVLRRFVDLPAEPAEARRLLDEVGLEVKRMDVTQPGVAITLELLANRGDHHGLVGLAREISGRTGGEVREPEALPLQVGESPHPVVIATDLCPVYTLTLLERTGDGELPAEATDILLAAGLKPVSPVVDATNIANLELGQPTHAFDADTIVGPITVRTSRAGERAWPLFRPEPVTLPEGTLVIADDEKILAIAGVIGCEESKSTEHTRRVLLESAGFDPVAVRKAARALDIHTDSSARFERGGDFALPLRGAGRVALLLRSAGWEVRGTTGRAGTWKDPLRTVPFDPEACRRFLDVDEDDATLIARLRRYGFRVGPDTTFTVSGEPAHPERFEVLVPTWRLWDVEHPADLYEEIAKSIGYDAIPSGLPPVDMGALPGRYEVVTDTLAGVLVGAGFHEVITDGFYSRALREQMGFGGGHPLHAHVETANALDRAYSLLKNNALAQAVDGVALNVRYKLDQVKAFEFTRTFHPDPSAPNGVCTERRLLWAIASGDERPRSWAGAARPADAWFLKGLVQEMAVALRLPLEVGTPDPSHPLSSALHPGRQAAIRLRGEVVGILGEVHPAVLARFKLKRIRPVYLEIGLDPLLQAEPEPVTYVEPPRVPPVVRNLAFTLPPRVTVAEVADVLRGAGPSWLLHVDVVDRFDHEEDGRPVSTYTFALTYDNEEEVRTAEALNGATEALVEAVHAALGGRGVKLRGA